MILAAQEIAREYRLDFNNGEAHWDDAIAPEVTSEVLGTRTTCIISRTSLLAWTLTHIAEVDVADVTAEGWIKISLNTGPAFDEASFREAISAVLNRVLGVRRHRGPDPSIRPHLPSRRSQTHVAFADQAVAGIAGRAAAAP
jgi:hypothetical protein